MGRGGGRGARKNKDRRGARWHDTGAGYARVQDGHDDDSDTTDEDGDGFRRLAHEEERALALDLREFLVCIAPQFPEDGPAEVSLANRRRKHRVAEDLADRPAELGNKRMDRRKHKASCRRAECHHHQLSSKWDFPKPFDTYKDDEHTTVVVVPTGTVEEHEDWQTTHAGRRATRLYRKILRNYPSCRKPVRKPVAELMWLGYDQRGASLRNEALAAMWFSPYTGFAFKAKVRELTPRDYWARRRWRRPAAMNHPQHWDTTSIMDLHPERSMPFREQQQKHEERLAQSYKGPTTRSRQARRVQHLHTGRPMPASENPWPPELYAPAYAAVLRTGKREAGKRPLPAPYLPTHAYLCGMPTAVVNIIAEYVVLEVQVHVRMEHVPLDPNLPSNRYHRDSREDLCARPVRSRAHACTRVRPQHAYAHTHTRTHAHTHTHTHTHTHMPRWRQRWVCLSTQLPGTQAFVFSVMPILAVAATVCPG